MFKPKHVLELSNKFATHHAKTVEHLRKKESEFIETIQHIKDGMARVQSDVDAIDCKRSDLLLCLSELAFRLKRMNTEVQVLRSEIGERVDVVLKALG